MAYCCNQSTCEPGFIADHTCDGVFAGYSGIVGDKHMRAAARSKRKLVKLMDQATSVLTVDLWSLASVARFIVKQIEDDEPFDQEELRFLKSFAGLVERLCKDQYNREPGGAVMSNDKLINNAQPDFYCHTLARIDKLGPNRRLIFTVPRAEGEGYTTSS